MWKSNVMRGRQDLRKRNKQGGERTRQMERRTGQVGATRLLCLTKQRQYLYAVNKAHLTYPFDTEIIIMRAHG